MWPFGRKRDAIDPTRCAECGRTLLSGEWTQRVVEEDGRELLICSLCSQSHSWESPADAGQTPTAQDGSRATASERDTRRRSDAFWLALKEKDAEIADLRARLARSEAERDELAGKLARARDEEGGATGGAALAPSDGEAAPELEATTLAAVGLQAGPADEDSSTAPEGAESQAAAGVAPGAAGIERTPAATEGAVAGEATEDRPELVATVEAGEKTEDWPEPVAATAQQEAGLRESGAELEDTLAGTTPAAESLDAAVASGGAASVAAGAGAGSAQPEQVAPGSTEDYPTDEELHLLQRGVDVLNVSQVPKKIAETSASLGVPFVHVASGPDADVRVTFMWPLGWYRYSVVLEGAGRVTLAERGYEELPDVQPNCTVRGDGTVQLAPTFGKRPTPKEETAADTEPSVTTASVTSGVIISKSLLGQRTDDETVGPWDGQSPRDFDWGR